MTKSCSQCKQELSLDNFSKRSASVDGLQSACRKCRIAYAQSYYIKNKQKFIDKATAWNKANPEKSKKAIECWRLANKDHSYQVARLRLENNPIAKLATILRQRLNKAVKGNYKSGSAVKDLGCSLEQLKVYLESKFLPGMSWDNYGRTGWHIDHIIPISSFDLTDSIQVAIACHYTNLQPLWAADNIRKSNKVA